MDAAPPAPAGNPQSAIRNPESVGAALSVLDGLLVAAVLVLAFLLGSFIARNADLWGNLAVGRLVATGQYPFGLDPFSALDPPPTWINSAWLTGLLFYTLYQAAGGPALVLLKAVLVTALAGVMLLTSGYSLDPARRRGWWLPAVATSLALLAISPRLFLQPPVVSYLLLGVLFYMLNRPPRRQWWRLPVAMGVLFLLWANLDSGFVFGLGLLALWLVGAALQQFLPLGEPPDANVGHAPGALVVALLVAVAACVVNPYHVRVFQLPSEFASWSLPAELRADRYFEPYFRVPFAQAYSAQVGIAPAVAYYLLFGLGLGSFAVNAGGWRWNLALVWLAFAWLSTLSFRLVPYFAVVAGSVVVLNLHAAFARRAAATPALGGRAAFTRAYLAGAGRVLTLLVLVGLAALAWPGWLAGDYAAHQPQRRVGWDIEPEPTMERVARQMADWYAANALRPDEERGFHLYPEFALICAWFCPQEKGLIDTRLAAPPEVAADYSRLRRAVLGLGARGATRPDEPPIPPPQEMLRKLRISHVVLTHQPPGSALAQALWRDPVQFPFWALTGRGLIFGWNDPSRTGPDLRAGLRLNPAELAFGASVQPVPSLTVVSGPRPPSAWERFARGVPPVPVEAQEAALWVTYSDAVPQPSQIAMQAWQAMFALAQAAPSGLPTPLARLLDLSPIGQAAPHLAWRAVFQHMQPNPSAPVLAVRAARRAILANPDDYEPYLRLGQALGLMPTDAELGWIQRRAALAQAVARMANARPPAGDAFVAHAQLHDLYLSPPPFEDGVTRRARPPFFDLALDSLEQMFAYLPGMVAETGLPPEQAEAQAKALHERLQGLRQEVKQRTDDYLTRTTRAAPSARAGAAFGHGLVKEALDVLRATDGQQLGPDGASLWVELEMYAGDVSTARDLLSSSDRPVQFQPHFNRLAIQAAAVVGDYDWADGELTTIEDRLTPMVAKTLPEQVGVTMQSLVAPGVSAVPAVQLITNYLIFGDASQRAVHLRSQQHALYQSHFWHGLLALEAGNLPLARRQFAKATPYEAAQMYSRYLGK